MLELVSSILINLFSSQLYDGKANVVEKARLYFFRKKLLKRTREYINKHDESVLTTGDFEYFLGNYRLIEDMFFQISSGNTGKSKKQFVKEKIKLFHSMQRHPEKNRFDTDLVLAGFIERFYDDIEYFFRKNLSQNQKYLASIIHRKSENVKDSVIDSKNEILSSLDGIRADLQKGNRLEDSEKVWEIYQIISKSVINGKITDVLQIFPLLQGKSSDLEISIAFLLGLFSEETIYSDDIIYPQKKVKDDRIYTDICRKSIYVNLWRKKKEELEKISIRNKDLHKIARCILEENKDDFYIIERKEQDGITVFNYKMVDHFPCENWLVRRICLLDILQLPLINPSESCKSALEHFDNVIDSIIYLNQRIKEKYNKIEVDQATTKELYEEATKLMSSCNGLSIDLIQAISEILLRSALMVSADEVYKAYELVPEKVINDKDITFLLLQARIDKRDVKPDEIIETCMKYGEYWVFNNYLVEQMDDDLEGTKSLIEKYIFVIDKDPSVFLLYVQLINKIDGKERAIDLFSKYKKLYGDILEFGITELRISFSNQYLNDLIREYMAGNLKQISNNGTLDLVRILVRNEKLDDALTIIKRQETQNNMSPELLRLKGIALSKSNCEIEALSVFCGVYNSGICDEEILYYILALACNNNRPIPVDVLACAEKSENPAILLLVSNVYLMEQKIDFATHFNMKAMLRSKDDKSKAFNQCLAIEAKAPHFKVVETECIDVDTVVTLRGALKSDTVSYAIHSDLVLPEEPYYWENVNHIYKETAISLGLLRRKVGEILKIRNGNYKVEEILPLSTYFFRVSIEKVGVNGGLKEISIPIEADDTINRERLTEIIRNEIGDDSKQSLWLEQYKDLTQIPVTFHYSKRFVRVNHYQLVSAILIDKGIVFRELGGFFEQKKENYILSYAALVVLFKLEWKRANKRCSVPMTLKKIIEAEAEEAINSNNRDHVAFMGIQSDKLYFIENSEEEKTCIMKEAVEIQKYCKKFSSMNNETDIRITDDDDFDLKELLGIADYDAVSIARNTGRVLVSAEVMLSGICQMPDINVETIGIADFLAFEVDDTDELLEYTQKMMEFRCSVPFTVNTINRLIVTCANCDEEYRKSIMQKWGCILKIPMKDDEYRNIIALHVQESLIHLSEEKRLSSIGMQLMQSWLEYLGKKIAISINQNGELVTELVDAEY